MVNFPDARIPLEVHGRRGSKREIEAVIDTGYTAFLCLPLALVSALDLRLKGYGRGPLADGTECQFARYFTKVFWDGRIREIVVDEVDTEPLVGMSLMKGHELRMQIRTGGKVTIKPLRKE